MDNINISNLDLNLLRSFVVLMEERNVSRASERLNISQSAASNALERIRDSFQDRVLEREGRTMQPTRAAEYLLPKIKAALTDIDNALTSYVEFEPALLEEEFRIGIDEYSMTLFGDFLIDSVFQFAPNVRLAFHPVDPSRYSEQLSRNELDLLVAPVWQSLQDVVQHSLYSERFIGLTGAKHPLAGNKVTLKKYLKFPHLLVSSRGIVPGNVDVALKSKKLKRHVAMSTPWLNSAPNMLAHSDMILMMGERLAKRYLHDSTVAAFEPPLDVPGFEVKLLWHPRNTTDPRHSWLRTQVTDVFSNLPDA